MRIFLTGGTGLLGSHVAEIATAEGASVVSLVRPTSNTAYLESLGVALCIGNIRDVASLASGMKDCNAVVHTASPIGGLVSKILYEENTINGTSNIIAAMEASSVKTLVHISTISVHGLDPIQGKPVSEANGFGSQFLPYDYYGPAKVKAEKMVKEAHEEGRIQATVLRPGWIYGPRDNNSYGRLADMMRRGMVIKVGSGENQISLVYAGNVARAIWIALDKESPDYRVYLCANDGKATQNDYFESVARATNKMRGLISFPKSFLLALGALQEFLSFLSGYRIPVLLSRYVVHLLGSDWSFDQSRIERDLGYSPQVGYGQGFETIEEWYRESRSIK
ncbi:NAD-dependent epimerase/dehydratase family protein [Chloroflexota bacterium]